jgi:hypothetical protein
VSHRFSPVALALSAALLTGCASSTPPSTTTVSAQGLTLSATMQTRVVPDKAYPVSLKLTNVGRKAQTLYTHVGDIFGLYVTDSKGASVFNWDVATGRSQISGPGPAPLRLAPGASVTERRWFTVPRPGSFTVAVDFNTPGFNPQKLGRLLRVQVECR